MVRNILLSLLVCCSLKVNGQFDNLKHVKDYQTGTYGALGKVEKIGNGDQSLVLIAGWGFDGSIFLPLTTAQKEKYTMYVVTLPGFGDTQAPPMPENNESYSDLYWTKGIVSALKELIEKEQMERPVLLSYFTYSNIIALRVALDYPSLVHKVVIVSGMAKFMPNYPSYEASVLQERVYYIENVMAPQWFKIINKETWDQGNFSQEGFSKDSIRAKTYWDQMSSVPIPVMVRYLCEYYCTDLSLEYENLKIPTLVVLPQFTSKVLSKPSNAYWANFMHNSWWGAKPANSNFQIMTISDTEAFILEDQPDKLMEVINLFVDGQLGRYDLMR